MQTLKRYPAKGERTHRRETRDSVVSRRIVNDEPKTCTHTRAQINLHGPEIDVNTHINARTNSEVMFRSAAAVPFVCINCHTFYERNARTLELLRWHVGVHVCVRQFLG